MSEPRDPLLNFTEAHLKQAMMRALRTVAILTVIAFVALLATRGWPTAMLLVAGAVVSASGLWEWQKLVTLVNARFEGEAKGAPGPARVVLGFFLRLGVAALILYGSLRCFHGSVYALVGGLGLAAFALGLEALRLVRT